MSSVQLALDYQLVCNIYNVLLEESCLLKMSVCLGSVFTIILLNGILRINKCLNTAFTCP